MFFSCANIFHSQFEPLFGLPRDTFCGMFLKPFNKLAGRVLSGLKPLSFASQLYTLINTLACLLNITSLTDNKIINTLDKEEEIMHKTDEALTF